MKPEHHLTLAGLLRKRTAIVTFISALLGLLVAFGVPITAQQQQIILGLIGLIFAWIGGTSYVAAQHVKAAAALAAEEARGARQAASDAQTQAMIQEVVRTLASLVPGHAPPTTPPTS
jgi:hypothetical protein